MPIIAEVLTTSIRSDVGAITMNSPSIILGTTEFPGTTSTITDRSTASFGSSSSVPSFVAKSQRQLVDTATAVIAAGITIIGVNFNGPVSITLADSEANLSEIDVVDEGGFCDPTNTITLQTSALSDDPSGRVVLTTPYESMQIRNNGSSWFSQVKSDVTILDPVTGGHIVESQDGTLVVVDSSGNSEQTNPDGSTKTTDSSGVSTTENTDGSTVIVGTNGVSTQTYPAAEDGSVTEIVINPDGSSVATISDTTGGSSSSTILADGTTIDAVSENNGNSTSYTVLPDGTSIDSSQSNTGSTNSLTSYPDGSSLEETIRSNGNEFETFIHADGQVDTSTARNSGTTVQSNVYPDGSSYKFRVGSNTVVTITEVDSVGVETITTCRPWQSYCIVTTTPPGRSIRESPNPYET